MDGIESKCRNRSPEETLAVFEDMKKGGEVATLDLWTWCSSHDA